MANYDLSAQENPPDRPYLARRRGRPVGQLNAPAEHYRDLVTELFAVQPRTQDSVGAELIEGNVDVLEFAQARRRYRRPKRKGLMARHDEAASRPGIGHVRAIWGGALPASVVSGPRCPQDSSHALRGCLHPHVTGTVQAGLCRPRQRILRWSSTRLMTRMNTNGERPCGHVRPRRRRGPAARDGLLVEQWRNGHPYGRCDGRGGQPSDVRQSRPQRATTIKQEE